jgi:hypothetical protein
VDHPHLPTPVPSTFSGVVESIDLLCIICWFQAFAFKCNVYRYAKTEDARTYMVQYGVVPVLCALLSDDESPTASSSAAAALHNLAQSPEVRVVTPGGVRLVTWT